MCVPSGGRNEANLYLSSVEFWTGTSFNHSTEMPYETEYSCAAALNSTHFIISGGSDRTDGFLNHVYLSDGVTYTMLPSMPNDGR